MIIIVKELAQLLNCSEKTARSHFKQIKKKYNIKIITTWHIADYLGIDYLAFQVSYYYSIRKDFKYAREMMIEREKIFMEDSDKCLCGNKYILKKISETIVSFLFLISCSFYSYTTIFQFIPE